MKLGGAGMRGINTLIVSCTGDANSRRNASNFCLRVVVRWRRDNDPAEHDLRSSDSTVHGRK